MKKSASKNIGAAQHASTRNLAFEEYLLTDEPFYLPVANEVEIFEAAHSKRLPVLLKGPTGCGKTRFLEYMSHRLGPLPLITVACHEDLTATDLVGRYLLEGDETRWLDGPLTRAVKAGAICYLDEIVEARKDTTVLIHPLSDHRRILPIERRGQIIEAHDNFQLVLSYNPGYQTVLKDLKPSTRQRFVAIEFDYPSEEIERSIVQHEGGVTENVAGQLVRLAGKVRNLREHGLQEGVSTRLLVYTGQLIASGLAERVACQSGFVAALTDDQDVKNCLQEVVAAIFAE
ncbi:MAG TPA: CbbQ/NirQ/NorQ/GpvN family protein [Terriglobales bacterium]|jgi:nitric oxide reductase NorQ protein|nr:CbbQ/NirQ/NorQ/GpvN family protein [Terriglobales bacterium]